MAINLLAAVGAVLTLGQILELSQGEGDDEWIRWAELAALVVAGAYAIWSSLPQREIVLRHPDAAAQLTVSLGDLLDVTDEQIVVTVNRHLDADQTSVARRSLVGQLFDRVGDQTTLRDALRAARPEGDDSEVAVGTVISSQGAGRDVLFLAIPQRDEATKSSIVVNDIWAGLSALWSYAIRHELDRISMPIIGSGHSNAKVDVASLLMLQLASYHTFAQERRHGPPVRIMLHGDGAEMLALLELASDFAQKLGFRLQ